MRSMTPTVTRNARVLQVRELALLHDGVSVTDAARLHLEQDLILAGLGDRLLEQRELGAWGTDLHRLPVDRVVQMRHRQPKGTETDWPSCTPPRQSSHYHHERNHQGLDNVIPLPLGQPGKGAIRRHERLGGVLTHYRREAA
jgi:hypothetical protein